MGNLRRFTATAFMAAISVVLTRFASFRLAVAGIEGARVGFGSLPNILAGILLGPIYGALAGAVSDLVGFVLSPMGGYMPHFTLTAALGGLVPALVLMLLRKGFRIRLTVATLGMSVAVGTILVSWGLTPYFLHTLFGLDYRAIMPARIATGLVEIPMYAIALKAIYSGASRFVEIPSWQEG